MPLSPVTTKSPQTGASYSPKLHCGGTLLSVKEDNSKLLKSSETASETSTMASSMTSSVVTTSLVGASTVSVKPSTPTKLPPISNTTSTTKDLKDLITKSNTLLDKTVTVLVTPGPNTNSKASTNLDQTSNLNSIQNYNSNTTKSAHSQLYSDTTIDNRINEARASLSTLMSTMSTTKSQIKNALEVGKQHKSLSEQLDEKWNKFKADFDEVNKKLIGAIASDMGMDPSLKGLLDKNSIPYDPIEAEKRRKEREARDSQWWDQYSEEERRNVFGSNKEMVLKLKLEKKKLDNSSGKSKNGPGPKGTTTASNSAKSPIVTKTTVATKMESDPESSDTKSPDKFNSSPKPKTRVSFSETTDVVTIENDQNDIDDNIQTSETSDSDIKPSLKGLADKIRNKEIKKLVVMCGAGISVSAGIPDFRSKGGLYDQLKQQYNMDRPELVFDIEYFKQQPKPFHERALEMLPGKFRPTKTHFFLELLRRKGMLIRCYTQNIDTLEKLAGIPDDTMVYAHGSFSDVRCIDKTNCGKQMKLNDWKKIVERGEIAKCKHCNNSLVKPEIVFFGENLPTRFSQCMKKDFSEAECLLVMGTSLKVSPFNQLIGLEMKNKGLTPRVLINNEKVGTASDSAYSSFYSMGALLRSSATGTKQTPASNPGFRFDSEKNFRDLFLEGNCDDRIQELVDEIGGDWGRELKKIEKEYDEKFKKNGWSILVKGQELDNKNDSSDHEGPGAVAAGSGTSAVKNRTGSKGLAPLKNAKK